MEKPLNSGILGGNAFVSALRADPISASDSDFQFWRRGRDSNPRETYAPNTLARCRFRPLSHLSTYCTATLPYFFCFFYETPYAIAFLTAMTNFRLQTTHHSSMNMLYSPPRVSLFSHHTGTSCFLNRFAPKKTMSLENSSSRYEKLLFSERGK